MSPPPSTELASALSLARPYQRLALGWSVATALLSLAPAVYMFQVYDRVVNSRSLSTLLMLTVLVLGIYVVLVLTDAVREELLQRASRRIDQVLAVRVFDAVFAAQLRRPQGAGEQPLSDLRTVREFVTSPAAQAFAELPGAALFLLCIFWISPALGLAAAVGAVLHVLLAWWTERRTQPGLVKASRESTGALAYARGALQSAHVIESMGMLQGVHERWVRRQRQFLALQAGASDAAGASGALARSLQLLQGSVLLGLGCWLFLRGGLADGGGMIIVVSILGGKVLQPLVKAVTQWKQFVQVRDARGRLESLLGHFPARAPQMPLPAPSGRISVEGITVTAPGAEARLPLLRNVTFQVQPGTVLAVIGPSGAGKTTLARALLGLVPSASGKVRIDGIDAQARDKELLGTHLGYLPQEIALFDGTLAENVCRFGEIKPERLRSACQLAGLDELVAQLPQGADTPIGPGGTFLSGGQRQRVGLARALYGEPSLVILDEPYSNLDDEGEAVLLSAVRALRGRGATVVLITHLPSMLSVADAVLLLHDGAVHAHGPRDEVLAAMAKAREGRAVTASQGPSPSDTARRPA